MIDIYEIKVNIDEFESILNKIKSTIDINMPIALECLRYCNITSLKLNLFTTDMRILKTYIEYPSSTDVLLLNRNGITIINRDYSNNKYTFFVDINHDKSISFKRKLILKEIIEN